MAHYLTSWAAALTADAVRWHVRLPLDPMTVRVALIRQIVMASPRCTPR
jgi:hypothetical protein